MTTVTLKGVLTENVSITILRKCLLTKIWTNFSKKSKSAVADGKALSLARTQLGHNVSLLIVYAERIIIISHHTKFELANLKR